MALIAVDDCTLIGYVGVLVADGAVYPVRVVDCCNAEHEPLASRGLAADVNVAELGHKRAIIVLWASLPPPS